MDKIKEFFGIDIRSLAIFRIGLALILLADLFIRLFSLQAHYSDNGVLPRSVLIDQILDPAYFSLHFINGTWQVQLILFILAALLAIALLVGYRTRLATFLSWIFLISLQIRNPLVLQGGDLVLKMLLFWGIFLPLGACWSLDQKWSREKPPAKQVFSMGTAALLLQICFIYWFTAMMKTDAIWRVDGTAAWYALSIEQYATPLGVYLLNYPALLKYLTFFTLYLEGFGPFFAFSPVWTGPLRFATAVTFMLFHLLGLNLTMELGPFSYVCAVAWTAFLPSWFWDRLLQPAQETNEQPWKASCFSNLIAAFFLAYVLMWNIRSLEIDIPAYPPQADAIGFFSQVDQTWDMFSPFPLRSDGWFVIPAVLRDGSEVDLFRDGQPVTWDKPPLLSKTYKDDRWRSYMMNLLLTDNNEVYVSNYAGYLCQEWNSSRPYEKQLLSFDIYFMLRENQYGVANPPFEKTLIWHHECFEPKKRKDKSKRP